MARLCGVYQITNKEDGKSYIGSSIDIRCRWSVHLAEIKKHKGNRNLREAFEKHGANCFQFSVLEHCNEEQLAEREQFYIDNLKPEYNLSLKVFNWHGYKHTNRPTPYQRKMSTRCS